ncbi:MAG TPA: hypothetical protein VGM76_06530, partial [Lacipirellulaceae bacterium]
SINWGDGSPPTSPASATIDMHGGPNVLTTGSFDATHIYADNGNYTVTVRVADDDMTGNFSGGISGVDFVEKTFTITVDNRDPAFTKPVPSLDFLATNINIQGKTTVKVAYSDPGFDNFDNAPNSANGGQFAETPVYLVDWGDGTVDAMHLYAVAGTYNVTVTVTPPDGMPNQTFSINGFGSNNALTLVNGQTLNGTLKPYTFVIDWGDSVTGSTVNGVGAHATTTITMMLASPGTPLLNTGDASADKGFTGVNATSRTPGNPVTFTSGASEILHQYLGPPDPLNPTKDIAITVTVFDDDGAHTNSSTVFVKNPGINAQMIFIDTTPDVARLEFPVPAAVVALVQQQNTGAENIQNIKVRAAAGEMVAAADRYLELRVVYPDGTEGQGYQIKDEALNDLRAFFKTLPDGRYRVYLVRTENNSRRLVIEINVRRGHMIDPSDESEGTRDRPPTSEDQGQPAKPLNENPQLEAVPGGFGSNAPAAPDEIATVQSGAAVAAPPVELRSADGKSWIIEDVAPTDQPAKSEIEAPLRRAMSLAALGSVAASQPWSEEVDRALAEADEQSWKRLRRASRRGRPGRDSQRIRRLGNKIG